MDKELTKEDAVKLLTSDVGAWNKYRSDNPSWIPALGDANLRNADLSNANLYNANLNQNTLEKQEQVYLVVERAMEDTCKMYAGVLDSLSKGYGELEDREGTDG